MGNQYTPFAKIQKLRQNVLDSRRVDDHVVADSGELLNFKGYRLPGIYKGAETVCDPCALHLNRADLNNPVRNRAETGRLQIEYHKGIL